MRRRSPGPTPKQVRDHMAGLDALYRPATMAERIVDEFKEGASVESLGAKYPDRDIDVILRRHTTPGGER